MSSRRGLKGPPRRRSALSVFIPLPPTPARHGPLLPSSQVLFVSLLETPARPTAGLLPTWALVRG